MKAMRMHDPLVEAAAVFKALSDPTRLRILRNLACCPEDLGQTSAPTAGQVCCQITGAEKINSTISHHLKVLREAGLIEMERHGKSMWCCPNPAGLQTAAKYLEMLSEDSGACCK
jgi:ArsR family transcriptional regulator, arsenate/arsenite/antimonite-responsive transcriptional repressor